MVRCARLGVFTHVWKMDMMVWIIVRDSKFVRQYKNMGGQRQTRVDLASPDNPENTGRYKKSMGARMRLANPAD